MRLTFATLLLMCLFASSARSQSLLRRVDSDSLAGLSAAVVVDNCQLIHTTQLFPVDADGRLADVTSSEQFDRVLARLDEVITASDASRDRVVKLNVYVADAATRELVSKRLADWFGPESLPAVSFVATPLPVAEAKVALDAVIAVDWKRLYEAPVFGFLNASERAAEWAMLPRGDVVYISGQAEPGQLAEATRSTLDSLLRTLQHLELDRQHIIQIKCFLEPMSEVTVVDQEIRDFFDDQPIPPVSHVEWIGGSRPIEIELIASAPLSAAKETVTFAAPRGLSTSPVFSRVARLHGDRRIYTSGLYSTTDGDGEVQTRDIFRSLEKILAKAESDMQHLAKATYYVSDDDASAKLNAIRPSFYDPQRPPAASKAVVKDVAAERRSITIDMIAAPAAKSGS